MEERDEGVAGGVVCGDAVLGERGVAGLRVEWADALFWRQTACSVAERVRPARNR